MDRSRLDAERDRIGNQIASMSGNAIGLERLAYRLADSLREIAEARDTAIERAERSALDATAWNAAAQLAAESGWAWAAEQAEASYPGGLRDEDGVLNPEQTDAEWRQAWLDARARHEGYADHEERSRAAEES